MRYFLGCDVSKLKVDVSLVDEHGVEQWIDKVPNNMVAIASLLLTITGHYEGDYLQAVVEATGEYHYPLTEAAIALGIGCRVYNPILTKQGIKQSVRGKKTDRTDALIIARIGLRGEGRLYSPEPYRVTKYYSRGQQKLGELATTLKRYENHLTGALEDELSIAAKEMLAGIQAQFKAARAQFISDTADSAPIGIMQRLRTIPGVGPFIAANLIGEIQTIERFTSAKALIAYAGFDPKIRQSGHTLNSTGRLTKRGSGHLRRSLFIAASVARQHDPYFRALYDKKRAEGKPYTVANIVVARKLLTIVRSVWLNEQDYNLDYWTKDINQKTLT
ncbi:MAG TPA: IS110 family transposase [Candidatus Dormibacteraeota bacterium]|nr:IS110 family transposase [Candidatus Dormibacteraeota bacterium]